MTNPRSHPYRHHHHRHHHNRSRWKRRLREKNRIWTTKEKEKIVIPVIEFKKTLQQTCREYDISSGLLSRWIEKYKAEGISGLENKRKPGNPIAKYFTTKKFNSKEEELEYENMRLKIENERLKKGYIVKGDGSIVVFKK